MADILGLAQYVQQQGAIGKEAGQRSRLAKLYSQALAAPEDQRDSYLPQMAAESPEAANTARGQFGDMRKQAYDDLGREAGMFVALAQSGDPATAQAAYSRLAQKAQAAGHPVPPTYDPKMLPMIEKLAGVAGNPGGMIQSTFIDAQGNRVGIMRDGRTQVLGQNAPNNQIIDTGNGFVGVNKGNLSAAPVMLGGQAPQQPPMQGPAPQQVDMQMTPGADVPPQDYAAMMAAAENPDAVFKPQANGGTSGMQMPQGQQLRSVPKPAAPSALQDRIATAQRMGATPEQIKQMVVGGGQDVTPTVPGDTSKTGTDYLSTLPQQTASQVRALAEGRMQFPSGTALKSPYWQGMLSAVSQFDPNFDAVNYNARSNTRKAFTSGKEAQTVNALNTVAEHLGKFSDNAAALHNTGFPLYNRLKNFALAESGDPRIAAFNTNKKAVADEIAKVWRASGGSEADIQENLKNLDGAQSPEQLNAAIGTLTQLIYGKVSALQDQYASGMGTTQTPRPLVSKEAQAAFDKTLSRMHGNDTPSAGPKVIRYDAQGNRIP